jgi:hypothetical protein
LNDLLFIFGLARKLNDGIGAFTLRPSLWIWSVIRSQDDTFWLSYDTKSISLGGGTNNAILYFILHNAKFNTVVTKLLAAAVVVVLVFLIGRLECS